MLVIHEAVLINQSRLFTSSFSLLLTFCFFFGELKVLSQITWLHMVELKARDMSHKYINYRRAGVLWGSDSMIQLINAYNRMTITVPPVAKWSGSWQLVYSRECFLWYVSVALWTHISMHLKCRARVGVIHFSSCLSLKNLLRYLRNT